MPDYRQLGSIPRKRHTAHPNKPGYCGEGIYYEEVITTAGFGRAYSLAYHLRTPTRVKKSEMAGSSLFRAELWCIINSQQEVLQEEELVGLPKAREAQSFYRSAKQRFEDARFLLKAERTTGAVYLAGYGIECILKALILDSTARGKRQETLASFRGSKAHEFEWLLQQCRAISRESMPGDIRERLVDASSWSTDFRYHPGLIDREDAQVFIASAEAIIKWADGRM